MPCAWQESVSPNLLCQDTQTISWFCCLSVTIAEVFHCKERAANTGQQPQRQKINPSEAKGAKSHRKGGLKSVLKNMAQGPMPGATSVLAPCAVLTPIVITATIAAGHELLLLSKDIL